MNVDILPSCNLDNACPPKHHAQCSMLRATISKPLPPWYRSGKTNSCVSRLLRILESWICNFKLSFCASFRTCFLLRSHLRWIAEKANGFLRIAGTETLLRVSLHHSTSH